MMIAPRSVRPDQESRTLHVTWADGHESAIPFQALRDRCPCARCVSSRKTGRRALPMALATKLDEWKRVGNYALSFAWGDSHSEGIFAFDHLRGLCPCGECEVPERYR
jgi:DUF971 family protein